MVIHYAADYFPYGKILRSYQACTFSPRFLTTHHERDEATSYDNRGARLYDAEIGRFLGVDPLAQEYASWSSYHYVLGNPISIVDPTGAYSVYVDGVEQRGAAKDDWEGVANEHLGAFDDAINGVVVDKYGTVEDRGSTNQVVQKHGPNSYGFLGTLGGTINVNGIYTNLLNKNISAADELGYLDAFEFKNLVRTGGDWDLKANKNTIYGVGNDGKTLFSYGGNLLESQDIGNHHFGAVALGYGKFPSEKFILRQAGAYQIKSGTSKSEWQIYNEGPYGQKSLIPPYGDDPRDQAWIKAGFKYFKDNY